MRALRPAVLAAAAAALAAAGCDSGETRADAEVIVGVWSAETVNAQTRVAAVPLYRLDEGDREGGVEFTGTGRFALTLEPGTDGTVPVTVAGQTFNVPVGDVNLAGTYTLDDAADTVTLTPTAGAAFTLDYGLQGDDGLTLEANNAAALAALVGINQSDPRAQAFLAVVSGGSITFERTST